MRRQKRDTLSDIVTAYRSGTWACVLCDARLLFSFVEAEDCLWNNDNVYLEEVSVATTHRISKP